MPLKQYTIVIPTYNEQDSLQPLWQELRQVIAAIPATWEVIFVDDGSTDDSATIVKKLKQQAKTIKISLIRFRKNRGKAAALQAGFQEANGEVIFTLDADLQDDPQEIPQLIAKLDEGYDLVSGYKQHRHDPFHKTIPSHFFNSLVRWISGTSLRDINSGLKAYRQTVVKSLSIYGELYRFIPILAISEGFRVTEIPVNHRPRQYGKSKYGISRFIRGLLDLFTVTLLTKFTKRPLHLFGPLGLIFLLVGTALCVHLSYIHFAVDAKIGDRPLLLLGVLLIIAGIQLICTGLVAELITHYAHRLKYDPLQKIEELER